MFSTDDTIVAVATPPGRGGLAVLRISGADAAGVAGRLCGRQAFVPRRATRVGVRDQAGRPIDEAVATYFRAPHSYTAEDVVELGVHGGPAVVQAVLEAARVAGARLARPGEFTLRAFLNGRVDLVQAEAVADLVEAATPLQAQAAFDQLEGTLSRAIRAVEQRLFDLRARLEASIDFPEEGYQFVEPGALASEARGIAAEIAGLLRGARTGRLLREGWRVAVVGPPNVGKSTLFNWIVGTDRAIVSSHPGTTRDLVSATVDVGGFVVDLVDTAGVRGAVDDVEREGVARARQAAAAADLVLVVFDVSRERQAEDDEILALSPEGARLVVLNKRDQGIHPSWHTWSAGSGPGGAVCVSLLTGHDTDDLRLALRSRLAGGADFPRDRPIVTNVRHEALLRQAEAALERMQATLASSAAGEELLLVDLADALAALEDVAGRRTTGDLLERIFSRFCVGK